MEHRLSTKSILIIHYNSDRKNTHRIKTCNFPRILIILAFSRREIIIKKC